jgi:acyl-coenzyme A synthetase/AMP-(fatty) acid ligase
MPIDISYTTTLINSIVEDARPLCVFTKAKFSGRLTATSVVPIMLDTDWLDRVKEENSRHPASKYPVRVSLDDTAFVAYSSGTTGKPKGKQHMLASRICILNKTIHALSGG